MKIDITDLAVTFNKHPVLEQFCLSLPAHKFIGIIGPNGSGKSTLLKCIYRTQKPDSGTILLDGKNLHTYSIRETAQKQAVLAQHNYFNFDFEVIDVVLMGRSPYKGAMESDNEEDLQIARQNLQLVGMKDFAHSNFSLLSGGEQQRVMLARALTQQTECLILDEPTNHLDIKYQLQLLNIVRQRGLTVIAAIHDLNIAAMYCDVIVAMMQGKVIATGTPEEVLTPDLIYTMYEVNAQIMHRNDGRLYVLYNN